MSKTLKNALLKKSKEQISSTILFLENHLKDLSSGAQNDSKSSAGDKHETARAMMQIEQEKVGKQLKENQLQLAELNKINTENKSLHISFGSLVKTNKALLFIAVGLGKIKVGEEEVMVISSNSPLGMRLLGKKNLEQVEMNGANYLIQEIY